MVLAGMLVTPGLGGGICCEKRPGVLLKVLHEEEPSIQNVNSNAGMKPSINQHEKKINSIETWTSDLER